MASAHLERQEAVLAALRSLNSLTRLVQDIDPFTAERDLKNITKAVKDVTRDLEQVQEMFSAKS